jgi:hypothetical protein
MANMVDIMLVFACGLLCALVVFLRLDLFLQEDMSLKEKQEFIEKMLNMEEVSNIEKMNENELQSMNGGEGFEELGKVYRNPKTGKMLMIEKEKGAE